jgi:hypothetical protein
MVRVPVGPVILAIRTRAVGCGELRCVGRGTRGGSAASRLLCVVVAGAVGSAQTWLRWGSCSVWIGPNGGRQGLGMRTDRPVRHPRVVEGFPNRGS